ncbi:hypothetical protein [Caulobacter sp. DWR2-3-1b2]|uniref:hypothetical protein n=1 Tax=unclassified Caulobacter TaxID=2648921 RepID=UPI003CEDA033
METKFVSLGCVCQPHAQIERTGMVAPGFFDLLGSSWADLIRVLRNPHDDYGLDAIAWDDRSSVRGRESGLIMHHEFPRDEAGRVIITDEGRALCAARLRRRMKRFLALKGDVTFVRLGGVESPIEVDPYRFDPFRLTQDHVADLLAALDGLFPDLKFRVVMVYYNHKTHVSAKSTGQFRAYGLPDPRPLLAREDWWKGDDCAWSSVLEHFSSELAPVRVKKIASKHEIRAHGLTQSGRERL